MKQKDILLALGGGGARGLSHIGVIRALENAGYRIRGIAGTSIGSIIGGLYCAGRIPETEEFVRALDFSRMVRLLDLRLPVRGLMGGRRIESLLRKLANGKEIQDLDLPFLSVATELVDGTEVRLARGDLAQAMRASYAIPGFFTPVLINGKWLVDGGVSTPVPVRAAESLGRFPVVAVNVNSCGQPPITRAFDAIVGQDPRQVATAEPKILTTLSDSIAHLQFHLATYQLLAHPAAYALVPELRGVGLLDFHRADELVEAGRMTAEIALHSGELQLAVDHAAQRILRAE